jgi:predicted phage-related endonuclease
MGVAEIKNVDFFLGQEWEDEPPVAFQIQLQHQLAVTGLTWGSIVGLVGGNRFRWQDQTRNEEFIALLLEAEHEFVERVQKRLPPPADGSASTKALLKKLYPKDNGEAIALPVELIEADIQLRALKDAQKEAGKEIDRLENLFKQAIGEATAGALSNGVSYTHKWQQRAGYTCQATEFRVLRRQAAKGEKIKLSPEDFNGAAR